MLGIIWCFYQTPTPQVKLVVVTVVAVFRSLYSLAASSVSDGRVSSTSGAPHSSTPGPLTFQTTVSEAFKQTILINLTKLRSHLNPVVTPAAVQWDEPSGGSQFLMFRFRSLNWRVLSPDPALYASPVRKCCSRAPRRIPARLRSRPCRADRPLQGNLGDLGDPPCRFWVRPGYLVNLQRTNYNMWCNTWFIELKETLLMFPAHRNNTHGAQTGTNHLKWL